MGIILWAMITCALIPSARAEEPVAVEGQPESQAEPEPAPTEATYTFSQPVTLGARFGAPSYVFSVSTANAPSQSREKNIDYSPAPGLEFTLSLGYGDYALSWRQPLPKSTASRDTYGKTHYNDFRFEFAREQYALGVFHQRYDGFYTDLNGQMNHSRSSFGEDTGPSAPSPSGPSDIHQRSDIHARHFGLLAYYALPFLAVDPQAFLLAFQAGPKRPRAGFEMNLLTNAGYNYAAVEGDRPFVPQKRTQTFGEGASLRRIRMHSMSVAGGVASAYVFENRRTYLDGILLLGLGGQTQKSRYADSEQSKVAVVNDVHLKLGVVHAGDTHALGCHFAVDNWSTRTRDLRFNSSNMALEFSYVLAI